MKHCEICWVEISAYKRRYCSKCARVIDKKRAEGYRKKTKEKYT